MDELDTCCLFPLSLPLPFTGLHHVLHYSCQAESDPSWAHRQWIARRMRLVLAPMSSDWDWKLDCSYTTLCFSAGCSMPDEDGRMDMEGYEDFSDDPGSAADHAEAELVEGVQHPAFIFCAVLIARYANIASCNNC